MALQVNLIVQAQLPDDTLVARVIRGRLTFNAQDGDFLAERDLAMAALSSMTSEAAEEFREVLTEWASAVQRIINARSESGKPPDG